MGLKFSVDIPDREPPSDRVNPKNLIAGQDLYYSIVYAGNSIGKVGMGSQIRRVIEEKLPHNKYNRSNRRIASMLGVTTSKQKTGADYTHIENTLKGITLFEIEIIFHSLNNELNNPYSNFHKIAYGLYEGKYDTIFKEICATANDEPDEVTIFSKKYLRLPVGAYWDKKSPDDKYRILPYLYGPGFIGLSPYKLPRTANSKAPEYFFLPKRIKGADPTNTNINF